MPSTCYVPGSVSACVGVWACMCMCEMVLMEGSEDNLKKWVLSCYMGPEDWTQVIRFGTKGSGDLNMWQ